MIRAMDLTPPGGADPELPTVVLAHGWTMTHESWLPVVDALQARLPLRVVAYDQPGHGRSSAESPNPSIRELGEVLGCVLDVLAPTGQVVLGGHSMGGMTIMAYAGLRHPELVQRVRGVALVATAATLEGRKPIPLERQVMAIASRAPRIGPGPLVPARVQGRLIFGAGADPAHVKEAVRQIQRTSMPAIGRYFSALSQHDEVASLAHLEDVPTHILVGTRDRLTPVRWARQLHEQIPGSRLTVVEGCGHMLTYEATETVADALAAYLPAAV